MGREWRRRRTSGLIHQLVIGRAVATDQPLHGLIKLVMRPVSVLCFVCRSRLSCRSKATVKMFTVLHLTLQSSSAGAVRHRVELAPQPLEQLMLTFVAKTFILALHFRQTSSHCDTQTLLFSNSVCIGCGSHYSHSGRLAAVLDGSRTELDSRDRYPLGYVSPYSNYLEKKHY